MTLDLNHHRLEIPEFGDMGPRSPVEVWDDDDGYPCVTLMIDEDDEPAYVELTPNEARALAALLINAAEHQDRRALPAEAR